MVGSNLQRKVALRGILTITDLSYAKTVAKICIILVFTNILNLI